MTSTGMASSFQSVSYQQFVHPIFWKSKPYRIQILMAYFARLWFFLKLSFMLFVLGCLIILLVSHFLSWNYSRSVLGLMHQ